MPEYIPSWRNPKKRPTRPKWLPRPLYALASVAAGVMMLLPMHEAGGLGEAISLQLHEGQTSAIVLFILMGVLLAVLAVRMAKVGRWASAGFLVLIGIALVGIAKTDPYSLDHLFLFGATAVLMVGWLLVVANDLGDAAVGYMGFGALAGGLLSCCLIGHGERLLIACCLAGCNVLYYGYFSDPD